MYIWEFINENVDAIALVVAAIALILTVWSVWVQRDHNKKSLRPYPDIGVANYENYLSVSFHNKGLGPLIITKVNIYKGQNLLGNNLVDLMPDLPKGITWSDYIQRIEGRVLAPGEEKVLLELKGDDKKTNFKNARKLIRQSLKDLKVQIYYKGIYEDNFSPCERDLERFA